jgi:predicted metalloprotease with PDZ domain
MSVQDSMPIQYRIWPKNANAHLFSIEIIICDSSKELTLSLPNWIPGSYMIRDFARNIVEIHTSSGKLEKLSKDTWRLSGHNQQQTTIAYEVYAWDLSVRAAHLDQTHGYFNGTSVFLAVSGREQAPCLVEILGGIYEENWRVATSLPEATAELLQNTQDGKVAKRYGFGWYQAENYDDLIDHPVEMADFTLATFEACGVPHDFVLVGKHYADVDRICNDLKTICEHQIEFFGEPAPMSRYVFMTYVLGNGFGGLEHKSSTSLHCSRTDLPRKHEKAVSEGYRTFLELSSHEYFHTWNVKRIKPERFLPYELKAESYTDLLWVFEGFTSYYDDLILMRTGKISLQQYLDGVAKVITRVEMGAGRTKQSVLDSSFDAWTKFYKQDENAANAIVSYYTKGCLIALLLDLKIRLATNHQKSLDNVMHLLWENHGKPVIGVLPDTVQRIVNEITNSDFNQFFNLCLTSTDDLPLKETLAEFGLNLNYRSPKHQKDLAGAVKESATANLMVIHDKHAQGAMVKVVHDGGAAQKAGISAGDIIIAVDGLAVANDELDTMIGRFEIGETIEVHAFRRDELMIFEVTLEAARAYVAYFDKAISKSLPEHTKKWLQYS